MSATPPPHREDHKGWHTRWEEGNFPWHLTSVNPTLDVSGLSESNLLFRSIKVSIHTAHALVSLSHTHEQHEALGFGVKPIQSLYFLQKFCSPIRLFFKIYLNTYVGFHLCCALVEEEYLTSAFSALFV